MSTNAREFTNTNLISVVERASQILHHMRAIQLPLDEQALLAVTMQESAKKDFDKWECAAWILAELEIQELQIRNEDKSVEPFPINWNGGFIL